MERRGNGAGRYRFWDGKSGSAGAGGGFGGFAWGVPGNPGRKHRCDSIVFIELAGFVSHLHFFLQSCAECG